jgi:two-component system response regulator HydG
MSELLRILVVDDDRRMAKTLASIFRVKGYEAVVAHSGSEALNKMAGGPFGCAQDRPFGGAQDKPFGCAQNGPFDCVLSDIRMPEMDGVELYRAIKARWPDLPMVLITAYSADRLVEEGLEEGAVAALTKPLDINALLRFFSSLRREHSVVVVDDDARFCQTLADMLQQRSFTVTPVTDPHGVVKMLKAEGQVVLLDMKLDGVGGLEVLRQIREHYPRLPVILVTGYREEMAQEIAVALKMGAYACLYKPFQIEELLQLLTRIRRQELRRVLGC